jgi:hypothetical protein
MPSICDLYAGNRLFISNTSRYFDISTVRKHYIMMSDCHGGEEVDFDVLCCVDL